MRFLSSYIFLESEKKHLKHEEQLLDDAGRLGLNMACRPSAQRQPLKFVVSGIFCLFVSLGY